MNFPPQLHTDPVPFLKLGEFIREREIDLHIVGGCGHYCALYLIPAAKTVYIEPYGYIYHRGSFTGLLLQTVQGGNAQRKKYMQQLEDTWLPQLNREEMIDFIVNEMLFIASSPDDLQETLAILQVRLNKDVEEQGKEFDKNFKNIQS